MDPYRSGLSFSSQRLRELARFDLEYDAQGTLHGSNSKRRAGQPDKRLGRDLDILESQNKTCVTTWTRKSQSCTVNRKKCYRNLGRDLEDREDVMVEASHAVQDRDRVGVGPARESPLLDDRMDFVTQVQARGHCFGSRGSCRTNRGTLWRDAWRNISARINHTRSGRFHFRVARPRVVQFHGVVGTLSFYSRCPV